MPPGLDQQAAAAFLDALEKEYVNGQDQAVQAFFDSQSLPDHLGQSLEHIENRVREAPDPSAIIVSLRAEWSGGSSFSADQMSGQGELPGGFRRMSDHLGTGSGDEIGDLRVTFTKVPCGPTTILAVQSGNSFEPMECTATVSSDGKVAKASGLVEPLIPTGQNVGINFDAENVSFSGGCCACCTACKACGDLIESGESVYQIQEEYMSAKEILEAAMGGQNCLHLVLKIAGWLMMVIGLNMMFDPFPALFRFLPFIGTYIQTFVGWITGFIAFLLASSLAAITIGLAWLVAHPARGVMYLGAAAGCIALMYVVATMAMQPSDQTSYSSPYL